MAAHAGSSVSNSSEAPPSYLPLPLLISESLRSAICADGSNTQGIVSVLLSRADLAKLDLSNLQLFSVDGFAVEPADSMESVEQTDVKTPFGDDFTFQTPLVLSPVSDIPAGSFGFPVLKSKGVVEAERTTAERRFLNVGGVSPSPRARKKAASMDEISLNEQLRGIDGGVVENAPGKGNRKVDVNRGGVRVRRQLPDLELAPLSHPCSGQWALSQHPGLEQRAETLKKKHVERVLSRKLSEVRSEEVKIDLKASPAAKFLLQVMPWELTPPVTPTTPAAIPFIWEDVPGRPKPCPRPSPCSSLPLPPRLAPAPVPRSSSTASCPSACSSLDATEFAGGQDQKSSVATTSKPACGGRHRRNMHSWHFLHNFFTAGGNQECPSQPADTILDVDNASNSSVVSRLGDLSFGSEEMSTAGISTMSDCVSSRLTSLDLSPSTATSSKDRESLCETTLCARYELPPLYVPPITPLTPPHKDLGPLDDDCSKQIKRLSCLMKMSRQETGQRKELLRAGSFFHRFKRHGKVTSDGSSYVLDDAKGAQVSGEASSCLHVEEQGHYAHSELGLSARKTQSASACHSPSVSSSCQSPNPNRHKTHSALSSTKFLIRLRKRGARVFVASLKTIKRAMFVRGAHRSKLSKLSSLPYHSLYR